MRAMKSTRKKLYASEEKCSWSQVLLKSSTPEVMTSSETSSLEVPHQKQNH